MSHGVSRMSRHRAGYKFGEWLRKAPMCQVFTSQGHRGIIARESRHVHKLSR